MLFAAAALIAPLQTPSLAAREPALWARAQTRDKAALEALAVKASEPRDIHLLGRLALEAQVLPVVKSGASALLARMSQGFDPLADPEAAPADLALLESLRSKEARTALERLLIRVEALPPEAGAELLRRADARGSREAQGAYGLRLLLGRGVAPDPEGGYRRVLAAGSPEALARAGEALEAKEPRKALKCLIQAAKGDRPGPAFAAGAGLERLARSLEEPALAGKAWDAYAVGLDLHHGPSAAALARLSFQSRDGAGPNYAKVRAFADQAVAWGAPEGHYWLGQLEGLGLDGRRDPASALAHFRLGADQGDAGCAYRLALAFEKGEGLAADATQANAWLTRAADAGRPEACFTLSTRLLKEGRAAEARGRLETAARAGFAPAQLQFAALCTSGQGGPEDLSQARQWLEKAASQGEGEAYYRLAMMDLDEMPTPANAHRVLDHLRSAAREGHAESQELLRLWRL